MTALHALAPEVLPQRLSLKLYTNGQGAFDGSAFVQVFHRWLQTRQVGRALIDLHNYSHLPNGPGVVLIGHEAHYRMDDTDGVLGLRYVRKRGLTGDWTARLQTVLRDTVHAAWVMSQESLEGGKLEFALDRLELRVEDRAVAPHIPERAAELSALAQEAWRATLGSLESKPVPEPRSPLGVMLYPSEVPSLEQLAERLGLEQN